MTIETNTEGDSNGRTETPRTDAPPGEAASDAPPTEPGEAPGAQAAGVLGDAGASEPPQTIGREQAAALLIHVSQAYGQAVAQQVAGTGKVNIVDMLIKQGVEIDRLTALVDVLATQHGLDDAALMVRMATLLDERTSKIPKVAIVAPVGGGNGPRQDRNGKLRR